jgi:hypothetical protein
VKKLGHWVKGHIFELSSCLGSVRWDCLLLVQHITSRGDLPSISSLICQ